MQTIRREGITQTFIVRAGSNRDNSVSTLATIRICFEGCSPRPNLDNDELATIREAAEHMLMENFKVLSVTQAVSE